MSKPRQIDDPLWRMVCQALMKTIDRHGPIHRHYVESAAKRIVSEIVAANLQDVTPEQADKYAKAFASWRTNHKNQKKAKWKQEKENNQRLRQEIKRLKGKEDRPKPVALSIPPAPKVVELPKRLPTLPKRLPQPMTSSKPVPPPKTQEDEMVELTKMLAHLRYRQRGMQPGHELQDWLEAEEIVKETLNFIRGKKRQ